MRKLLRPLGSMAVTVLLGGFVTAALVRTSPGFDADERQLDPRLDAESRAGIQQEHARNHDVLRFYARHIGAMLHGDFGMSSSLEAPIGQLIRSRLPVTAENMAVGLAGGWALAFLLALGASRLGSAVSVLLLSVPSAAPAVLVFLARGPMYVVIALVLFPRLFDFLRNLLEDAWGQPHIVTACAKGLPPALIIWRHVLPVCAPQLLALAGVSASMAFGASIPVETLSDVPGIGQLAWKAAMARDLPVLVTLTMLITLATQMCNAVADSWGRR